jgi:hypothetical protein
MLQDYCHKAIKGGIKFPQCKLLLIVTTRVIKAVRRGMATDYHLTLKQLKRGGEATP